MIFELSTLFLMGSPALLAAALESSESEDSTSIGINPLKVTGYPFVAKYDGDLIYNQDQALKYVSQSCKECSSSFCKRTKKKFVSVNLIKRMF